MVEPAQVQLVTMIAEVGPADAAVLLNDGLRLTRERMRRKRLMLAFAVLAMLACVECAQ